MNDENRKYIRHPVDIPIVLTVADELDTQYTKDICAGGLCFVCDHAVKAGQHIQIAISTYKFVFDAEGIVCWCRSDGQAYLIGMAFQDKSVAYAVRMVEQICHIENYRQQILAKTGVELSNQQAAQQWIDKHAGSFPII
ncbi:MAG: pilus assembly protein PilZ [Methylophaga sp.]|nr:MAG: pilus assembly protein PilZ [Methylophaga sp.]